MSRKKRSSRPKGAKSRPARLSELKVHMTRCPAKLWRELVEDIRKDRRGRIDDLDANGVLTVSGWPNGRTERLINEIQDEMAEDVERMPPSAGNQKLVIINTKDMPVPAKRQSARAEIGLLLAPKVSTREAGAIWRWLLEAMIRALKTAGDSPLMVMTTDDPMAQKKAQASGFPTKVVADP